MIAVSQIKILHQSIQSSGKGSKQHPNSAKEAYVVTKSYVLHWMFSNCACADCCVTSKARRAGNGLASSRSPVTSIDARCPLPVHLLPSLFSHPTPSKRSVDSASPNQRPVRRLSGLLSRGRSNLATSLRHKPN